MDIDATLCLCISRVIDTEVIVMYIFYKRFEYLLFSGYFFYCRIHNSLMRHITTILDNSTGYCCVLFVAGKLIPYIILDVCHMMVVTKI